MNRSRKEIENHGEAIITSTKHRNGTERIFEVSKKLKMSI